ncbi:hypothetical protein P3T43_004932, partial [Paraburkholderia sp. GAS41]
GFFNFLNLPTPPKALPLLALPFPAPRCPEREERDSSDPIRALQALF